MSAIPTRETCSRCHRGPRDNFERVQIAREQLCMRPRCKPSPALEHLPPPRWKAGHKPEDLR